MHYWEIHKWNGERIRVKPQNADIVKRKLTEGEGFINTPTGSINIKDIKEFTETGERYVDQNLIESGLPDFGEVQYTDVPIANGHVDQAIKAVWVKKSVPRREYNKYYSQIPSYRLLNDNDNYVDVAFRLPVHQIDYNRVEAVTGRELVSLQ